MKSNWKEQRNQIIGLGENSFKKSYYPELQLKISELEASYTNSQTIFNTINDGIVIHDEKGNILLLNNQSRKLFNITPGEKFTIFDLSSKNMDTSVLCRIWETVLNGNPAIVDWVITPVGADSDLYVQISVSSTLWYGKKVLISAIRDFSDRIKFENELIEAKEKAEDSDRLKTAFLQNMSHEIRTPLNAICGFAGLLGEPLISEETRNSYIKIIQNSSNQLLSIVTDILTISSLETRQEKINIQNTPVNLLLTDLLSIFRQQASERNISLSCQLSLSDSQSEINTDSTKLTQVLTNLLSNALKFTHEGSVEFGYKLVQHENAPVLQFFVKDSGIGIDKEYHKTIFERFRQADLSISQYYGGTGLGLSISKAFIELLDGKIWLESEPGEGSVFYFTIPYRPVQSSLKLENQPVLKGKMATVVVAEDEELNYLFLEILLKKFDFKILHAKNGKEAVDLCKSNPDVQLVLMDIKMPVMDGYTAAKLIKEFRRDIPVIAQTAYVLENEIKKYSGIFDGCLPKPIKKESLAAVISKYQ
jgi:signal transduction histidine kinase/CheY-like chemotaxis protein